MAKRLSVLDLVQELREIYTTRDLYCGEKSKPDWVNGPNRWIDLNETQYSKNHDRDWREEDEHEDELLVVIDLKLAQEWEGGEHDCSSISKP